MQFILGYFVKKSTARGDAGIEPATSRTLSENHTTRPITQRTFASAGALSLFSTWQKVLPGLEPGLPGSEPGVLTNYTIEPGCNVRNSEERYHDPPGKRSVCIRVFVDPTSYTSSEVV